MKKLFVMLLAVGLCVGAANADILLTSGPTYDVFITDPVAVGDNSENLISFDLKLVNTTGDAGYNASAFDGVDFGYTGITSGVFNSGSGLHQHWSSVLMMSSPTLDGVYPTAIDTHFLELVGNMTVVTMPSELDWDIGPSAEATDAPDAPPPADINMYRTFANTDFGSQLTGTFAVTAVPSLSLAQIVIKDPGGTLKAVPFGTGEVSLDFFISGPKGGDILHFDIVPEPATMGLLAIGALGALIRRRR